jgi:hypothetical protein
MTYTHAVPGRRRPGIAVVRSGGLPDWAKKMLYFNLAATMFAFLSILLAGRHP